MKEDKKQIHELVSSDKITMEKKANLFMYYVNEGYTNKEAYLKLHPQHLDNPNSGQLAYSFTQNKQIKAKMKMLHTETGFLMFDKRLKALNREFEIGMGVHGGSLKTQADALNQFINNTELPQDKSRLEELQEKELEEKSKMLKSIQEVFNNLGSENIQDVEVIEELKN